MALDEIKMKEKKIIEDKNERNLINVRKKSQIALNKEQVPLVLRLSFVCDLSHHENKIRERQ